MDIGPASLCGHSFGGALSLFLAHSCPEIIKKLVLIAPSGGNKYALFHRVPTIPLVGEYLMNRFSTLQDIQDFFRHITYRFFPWPEESLKRYLEFNKSKGYVKALLRHLRNYLNICGTNARGRKILKQYEEIISQTKHETLLVFGKQDKMVPFETSRIFSENIPHISFWGLDNCGHCPHIEYVDEFNKRFKEFLYC
jgi:pimeloyl-ACP methyl ester carboxylesterase